MERLPLPLASLPMPLVPHWEPLRKCGGCWWVGGRRWAGRCPACPSRGRGGGSRRRGRPPPSTPPAPRQVCSDPGQPAIEQERRTLQTAGVERQSESVEDLLRRYRAEEDAFLEELESLASTAPSPTPSSVASSTALFTLPSSPLHAPPHNSASQSHLLGHLPCLTSRLLWDRPRRQLKTASAS